MLLHVNCLLISSLNDYYESDFFILNGMIRLCLVHDNGGNYELNFNIKGNASVEYYYVTIRFPHSKQVQMLYLGEYHHPNASYDIHLLVEGLFACTFIPDQK